MKALWIVLSVVAAVVVAVVAWMFLKKKRDVETTLTAQTADTTGTAPKPSTPGAVSATSLVADAKSGLNKIAALGASATLKGTSSGGSRSTLLANARSLIRNRPRLALKRA